MISPEGDWTTSEKKAKSESFGRKALKPQQHG
jgi:hypothetical protein